jgi:hypothetical protein
MKIGITGAGGFIGKNLSKALLLKGHHIVALNRGFDFGQVGQCEVVFNLAGASINRRWSKKGREEIYWSRIGTTRRLSSMIRECSSVKLLVSTSATGIYSTDDNLKHDEYQNTMGYGFLADVCKAWEKEALSVNDNTRVVIARLGVVMDQSGGALPRMALPFKFGAAAVMGKGSQYISWIMLEDLLRAFVSIAENSCIPNGNIVNMCAPNPITYKELATRLSELHKTFVKIRIPGFVLKMALGEASSIILKGQHVTSKVLQECGFNFTNPLFTLKK